MYLFLGILGGTIGSMPDPVLIAVFFVGWKLKKHGPFAVVLSGIAGGILAEFLCFLISSHSYLPYTGRFWLCKIIAGCLWGFLGYGIGRWREKKKTQTTSATEDVGSPPSPL